MMDAYIPTGLGILVSVALFLLGYRQTIGARKERVKAANNAVQKALIRRMVLEDYKPRYNDIGKILEGKAREFQVGAVDLHSEEEVLTQLFTEVFDNDLITPPQRADIEKRLDDVFDEVTRRKEQIGKATEQVEPPSRNQRDRLLALMGVTASLVGAVTALLFTITRKGILVPDNAFPDVKVLIPVIAVFLGSLAAVAAISIWKRGREEPEEPSKAMTSHEGIQLEQEIASALSKLGLLYEIEPPSAGLMRPDFLVKVNDKKIAIEAKAWRSPPPLRMFSMMRDRAKRLLESRAADQVIIVTNSRSPIPQSFSSIEGIKVMSVKELMAFLQKLAA